MAQSARSEMALFDIGVAAVSSRRDVIEATGPDAAEYLHGQLSQDVDGLDVGSAAMTLLLQPQGKIDAWMRLSRPSAATYWLDVEPGFGQAALDRLLRFKLRVDCDLVLSTREMTAVRGPDAAGGAEALGLELPDGAVVLPALWPGVDGFDVFAPVGPWLGEELPIVSADALDGLRIRLGIPAMGTELDSSTIPAAAGIVESSVDFTKGCYVGQELVARIDSRGSNTPTRLCGALAAGPVALAAGLPVVIDGGQVGALTSVAVDGEGGSTRALMYLKRAVSLPAGAVVSTTQGESVQVELIELPFA